MFQRYFVTLIMVCLFVCNTIYARTEKVSKSVDKPKVSLVELIEMSEGGEEYRFNAGDSSNPFIPPIISLIAPSIEVPVVNSLQKYRLQDLKVVGIWGVDDSPLNALILNPDGEGVIVKEGDPIGKEGGTIYKILAKSLVARIFSLTGDGVRIFEDYSIFIEGEDAYPDKKDVIIIKPSLEKVIEGYLEGKK